MIDHPWRPWRSDVAWKTEPFEGACGICAHPREEHPVDPPPVPVVADPALMIDLNHVDDMPSRRLWRWLRQRFDGDPQ